MSTISAIIIAKNEETNIGRCLKSVEWVDEIVVVDDGSTDRTLDIAREYGAKIFQIEWEGFGAAKNYALDKAISDWVLSIDADEEVTGELALEIKRVIKDDTSTGGFMIPRVTNFLGRWIKHSRWYPDYVLRLFKRKHGRFTEALVHEKVVLEGRNEHLKNHLKHYSYPDIDTYCRKLRNYSYLGANELYKNGKRFSPFQLIIKPPASFIRHYITGAGFLDGVEGFMIASLSAMGVMLKYIKLRELEKGAKG